LKQNNRFASQPAGFLVGIGDLSMLDLPNMKNLQTLKGFRDFLPPEARKRLYALEIIKDSFESFGFEPLETPALEYQSVLLGKYGTEADKLVYKFKDEGKRDVALRYDQTVPTARVLSTYNQRLPMPWKRYQIQPVWRAEKPQKGRFREFLQCDIDTFASKSPLADAEIIATSANALDRLGLESFKVFINDRNILFDLMKSAGISKDSQLSVISSLDKLDKKSEAEVKEELSNKGVSKSVIAKLFTMLSSAPKTSFLNQVIESAKKLGVKKEFIVFQPFLARGLDYYTSTIFEFAIDDYDAGSVAGGGRYDNLINQLGGVDIPAVGIAFGFDRIVEAMEKKSLFPENFGGVEVLVTVFSKKLQENSIAMATKLRKNNLNTETYLNEDTKLDKQLKYANKKGIPWVVIIGPDEVINDRVILKNMGTGKQNSVSMNQFIDTILKELKQ